MSARLPIPGQDDNTWGDVLNNYLAQTLQADGTLKPSVIDSTKLATTGTPSDGQVLSYSSGTLSWSTVSGSGATPDATTSAKGIVQLAGDLAGTAAAPTVPGLASREPTITAGTTAQYYRGDKSWQTLDKTAVGLANIDNTSDANKPVSSATSTALGLKAPLASPTFTGLPTVPTATTGTNTTQIASTAFVLANAGGGGTVTSVTTTDSNVSMLGTTTDPVVNLSSYPIFTGLSITNPTQDASMEVKTLGSGKGAYYALDSTGDQYGSIQGKVNGALKWMIGRAGQGHNYGIHFYTSAAVHAFALDDSQNATFYGNVSVAGGKNLLFATSGTGTMIGNGTTNKMSFWGATPVVQQTGNVLTALSATGLVASPTLAESDITNLTSDLGLKAPLASPTFTGTVTVPTPTNTTDATTKAYVDAQVSSGTADATTSTKGKIQLAGDLAGTSASPTVTATHLASPLGLSQGGTGSATQNFVDLTTDQTVAGIKTFSSQVLAGAYAGSSTGINLQSVATTVNTARFINIGAPGNSAGAGVVGIADGGVAAANTDRLGFFLLGGATDSSHSLQTSAGFEAFATETWSGTARGTQIKFRLTSTGTTTKVYPLILGGDSSATFAGHIEPGATATYNIGSSNYFAQSRISRMYLNATAYIDGATAGQVTNSGSFAATGRISSDSAIKVGGPYSTAGTDPLSGYLNGITSTSTTAPTLGIKAIGSQTGDLTRWVNSGGQVISKVNASGTISAQGIATVTSTKVADYTATANDHTILVNSTSAVTITLPSSSATAQALNSYAEIVIKNINTGVVTVAATAPDTIDGATTYLLSNQFDSTRLKSDGANWFIVSSAPATTGGGSGGSTARTITNVSTATTAGATASTDYIYFVSGTTTITLPTCVGNANRYTISNTGSATVTIACNGAQTINGITTATLDPNASLELVSNNSQWRVI